MANTWFIAGMVGVLAGLWVVATYHIRKLEEAARRPHVGLFSAHLAKFLENPPSSLDEAMPKVSPDLWLTVSFGLYRKYSEGSVKLRREILLSLIHDCRVMGL